MLKICLILQIYKSFFKNPKRSSSIEVKMSKMNKGTIEDSNAQAQWNNRANSGIFAGGAAELPLQTNLKIGTILRAPRNIQKFRWRAEA